MTEKENETNRLVGLLLGTAVGDSLGLPYEGLSRRRAAGIFSGPLQGENTNDNLFSITHSSDHKNG